MGITVSRMATIGSGFLAVTLIVAWGTQLAPSEGVIHYIPYPEDLSAEHPEAKRLHDSSETQLAALALSTDKIPRGHYPVGLDIRYEDEAFFESSSVRLAEWVSSNLEPHAPSPTYLSTIPRISWELTCEENDKLNLAKTLHELPDSLFTLVPQSGEMSDWNLYFTSGGLYYQLSASWADLADHRQYTLTLARYSNPNGLEGLENVPIESSKRLFTVSELEEQIHTILQTFPQAEFGQRTVLVGGITGPVGQKLDLEFRDGIVSGLSTTQIDCYAEGATLFCGCNERVP